MSWVLATTAAWFLLAIIVALVIGRSIHLADRTSAPAATEPDASNIVDQLIQTPAEQTAAVGGTGRTPSPRTANHAPSGPVQPAAVPQWHSVAGRAASGHDLG